MDQISILIPIFIMSVAVIVAINWSGILKRRSRLRQWATALGLHFSHRKDKRIKKQFKDLRFMEKDDNGCAYNIMEGEIDGRRATAFDFRMERKCGGDKSVQRISAMTLSADFPMKMLIIRPLNLSDKLAKMTGGEFIEFESAEFNERFFVHATDRKWAFAAIHQKTMEFLMKSPDFHIQCERDYIGVWRYKRFEIADFQVALDLVNGILDLMPEYLKEDICL